MMGKDFRLAVKLLSRLAYWPIGDLHIVVDGGAMMTYTPRVCLAELHGGHQDGLGQHAAIDPSVTTAYSIKHLKKIATKVKSGDEVRLLETSIVVGGVVFDLGAPPSLLCDCPELNKDRPTEAAYSVSGDLPFDRALHTASPDEGKPHLCGALLEVGGGKARVVCTDGHRLACPSIDVDTDAEASILIPLEAAELVRDIGGPYAVAWDAGSGVILCGDWRVYVWPPDARFPPWRKIFPSEYQLSVDIDIKVLLAAVKKVDMGSPGFSGITGAYPSSVIIDLREGDLRVYWEAMGGVPHVETRVPCKVTGAHDDPVMQLNTQYLSEALKHARVDRLQLDGHILQIGDDQLIMAMKR